MDTRAVLLGLTILPEDAFLSLDEVLLWEVDLRRECPFPEAVLSLEEEPSRLEDIRLDDVFFREDGLEEINLPEDALSFEEEANRLDECRLEDTRLDDIRLDVPL